MQRTASAPRAPSLSIPRPLLSGALCALLMGATTWAVLAAGWAQNAGGAVVVAVAATIEAALLARAAVPRWVALLLAPILALAAIVPTTLGAMPFDGNAAISHAVARYAAALTSGLAASTDWPFTVGLCAVLWLCGYWVAWLAMRERRGVLAVLPVYAVLATNVLNTRLVDNVALPEALAVCCSLLVVADAHLDSLQAHGSRGNVVALPGTRSRFAMSVAAMSVLLTVVALLLPSVSGADISARIFPGGGTNGRAGGHPSAGTAASAGTIQFNGSTQPGGALISQPQPVLTYTVDTTAPVYLRVVADTLFVSGNWYPDHVGDTSTDGGVTWDGIEFNAGSIPRDRASADGGVASLAKTVHADIVMQADATGNSALTPFVGEPESIDQGGIAYGQVQSRGRLLTVESVQLDAGIDAGTTVLTSGTLPTASAAQLRGAGTNYPAFVKPFTLLPDDFTKGTAVIAQLARAWTAGLTNPYDQAAAIEAHFRSASNFTYTLNPPPVPPNTWPIVYFLTTGHRGYCQYFAASMGAMLRSLGIPTRVVNGYGPGTTQAQSGRPGVRQQIVSTSDAHTWVEAYFPAFGWIPFEPTPPSPDGNYVPFQRGPAAASGPSNPSTLPSPNSSFKPGFNDPAFSAGTTGPGSSHGPSPLLVLGAIAGAIVALLLGFALWLLLPRSLRGTWRRLETLGLAWGMPRHPWETYRDYADRFDAAPSRVAAALAEIATLLGRAEFSRDGVDKATSKRALAIWRGVLVAVPRLTWTLRRRRFEPA